MQEPAAKSTGASTRALRILAVAFVLGLMFDYFFYGKALGISFPLYLVVLLASWLLLARIDGKAIVLRALWPMIPLLFFSSMVFVRDSVFLTFLNAALCVYLVLAFADLANGGRLSAYVLRDHAKMLLLPGRFLAGFPKVTGELVASPEGKARLTRVVWGVAIAIPILLLFIVLLGSANLVFGKYVSDVIDAISAETAFRTLLVIVVAAVVAGFFVYTLSTDRGVSPGVPTQNEALHQEGDGRTASIEVYVVLGSVAALFLAFIAVEFAYLFGGKQLVAAQGFTYAQYARRGFFELIAVAVLTFVVIRGAELFVPRHEAGHSIAFKCLSGTLIAEVIMMMVSGFKRLSLYEAAYGFTVLRLYSHLFTLLLAVVFVLLAYKVVFDDKENAFVWRCFVSAVLFLVLLNLLNPDAFIAGQNISRYKEIGKLDTAYLNSLSDDAVPEMVTILGSSNKKMVASLSTRLKARKRVLAKAERKSTWQSWNLSRTEALRALENRKE